ncbi:glycosyltransferase family 4 protein [Sporosarcina pasteurii]|uniref:Undecaprenyl-phosphate alpha-N-acetylglucosaminyl 1-phosphate transferase n=1 Tax=Sporosarcina pasteurii TaxID=1474 RepID=A0A380BG05_SPOPA|nr:MraY family glycosyltransferase [Sporosarcina pasteurii]MDS9470294.1 MraY family glycosyltransferase [Sporosarcina pasteurii]QBQ05991.1 undecaprenyl/decaprenyl-phosphate alpha-N-acetylglucosaminyl 1-phosphate transferase [Sporosarcina pasteurii]SUI99724.1 Undecaprenyl-phosphate alpha-N-acetylglucosaminyl 1-phosphate transferase [Sporosarcina pasteurii]
MLFFAIVVTFIASIIFTPIVRRFAFRIGALDKPNYRKVHTTIMPRIGGLAIFGAFLVGYLILLPEDSHSLGILVGAVIIILTGFLDDMLEITAKAKVVGQLAAAVVVVTWGGLQIEFINLPFGGQLEFGFLSIPITILWIISITNVINLIDGLDGLAAGVSTIALISLAIMAIIMGNPFVIATAAILAASSFGFLFYNFYPAKIFMGDTGALFLGYMISVLALLGFKNVAIISLIIPVLMLGVPISDTFFAIVRRIRMKQKISAPDKSHLHHCLLKSGFSHRQSVLIIYGIAALFGLAAILFSQATVWGSIILLVVIVLALELFVEAIGLAGANYRPLLNLVRMIGR